MKENKFKIVNYATKESADLGAVRFLTEHQVEKISKTITDIISDGRQYVVKMDDIRLTDVPDTYEIKVYREFYVTPLVTCEECKYEKYCDKAIRRHNITFNPITYCSFGDRKGE